MDGGRPFRAAAGVAAHTWLQRVRPAGHYQSSASATATARIGGAVVRQIATPALAHKPYPKDREFNSITDLAFGSYEFLFISHLARPKAGSLNDGLNLPEGMPSLRMTHRG